MESKRGDVRERNEKGWSAHEIGSRLARAFLDTSVLSRAFINELADGLSEEASVGKELVVSVLTRFEVRWGYRMPNLDVSHYEDFLEKLRVNVVHLPALLAAGKKSGKGKACGCFERRRSRYDAIVWAKDGTLPSFFPKKGLRFCKAVKSGPPRLLTTNRFDVQLDGSNPELLGCHGYE